MKKFSILALAAVLVIALTVPAAALENEFGGYWRTRFVNQGHFSGESDDGTNLRRVDTRTRLYYTAKINDNLKFVNKFEMDAVWGQPGTYGRPDADVVAVEVKNSYADFNLGPVNLTVGVQPYALFRSFYIDTDASGIIARWKVLDNVVLAGSWLKNYEENTAGSNNSDVDAYTLSAGIWFSENISIKPSISYARSSDSSNFYAGLLANIAAGDLPYNLGQALDPAVSGLAGKGELELFTYGFDFDANFDNFGLWATLIGQTGEIENNFAGVSDIDLKGWLAAIGGNVALGPVDLHGEFFYSPGDDDADSDIDLFVAPNGSYYWAEIMGCGIFDNQTSAGSPYDHISNIWAANIGTTFKPADKLAVTVDLWYAQLDEDDVFGEDELGTELDVKVTYELVEGLNLDLVGAYLFAGDATSLDGDNDDDPYEIGARLSLSF